MFVGYQRACICRLEVAGRGKPNTTPSREVNRVALSEPELSGVSKFLAKRPPISRDCGRCLDIPCPPTATFSQQCWYFSRAQRCSRPHAIGYIPFSNDAAKEQGWEREQVFAVVRPARFNGDRLPFGQQVVLLRERKPQRFQYSYRAPRLRGICEILSQPASTISKVLSRIIELVKSASLVMQFSIVFESISKTHAAGPS